MTEDRFNDLERRLALVEEYTMNEDWIAPALLNGWVNYTSVSGYNPVGYFKSKDNIVYVRGLVANGTITDGTAVFNLPPRYRPKYNYVFNCPFFGGTGRLDVQASGDVLIYSVSSNNFVSLDAIQFAVR